MNVGLTMKIFRRSVEPPQLRAASLLLFLLLLIRENYSFTTALSATNSKSGPLSKTGPRGAAADDRRFSRGGTAATLASSLPDCGRGSRTPGKDDGRHVSLSASVAADYRAADIPAGGGGRAASSKSSSSTSADDEADKQSLPGATFNLVKACLGSGVLSLPGGVAAIGDVPAALLPASILLSTLGALSAYSFYTIGRICSTVGATSIGEAWEKTVGKDSSWLVTLSCFITPLGAALSYSIILGDFFSSLAKSAGIKGFLATRHASILLVTLLALYPLCSLKSLASLSPVSIVGVGSVLLTCVFMGLRATDGSYNPGGAFYSTLDSSLQPSFGKVGVNVLSPSVLVLCSMAATAYMVHFVAPDFYEGLKSRSVRRFKILTSVGMSITAALSVLMMCLGFLTFGGHSSGMIVNNYSTADIGASMCRLLMAISLIGSYPFTFSAMRTNYLKMRNKGTVTDAINKKCTRFLLGATTALALLMKDVGFVVGFNGALMGSAIIYIVPSLMFLKSTRTRVEAGKLETSKSLTLERIFNKFLIALGAILAIVGGAICVVQSFFPQLLK